MGVQHNVGIGKFPKQGSLIGKRVNVIFAYDSSQRIGGECVRDDAEEPWRTLIRLDDGRFVDAHECQFSFAHASTENPTP